MKYKNNRTGIIIDIPSVLKKGGEWELVEAPAPKPKKVTKNDKLRNDK